MRGFPGRNGAGKTTTLKILLGMTRAGSGSARVFGLDCADAAQSVAIWQRVGFVIKTKSLYPYMTIGETIRFTARPGCRGPVWNVYSNPGVVFRCW